MSARANALRLRVEMALAGRVASPFEYRERQVETAPAGVPEIDRLTGGLPRGGLTEICGPASSGRTSVLMAAMAARTKAAEVCALVDARDAFDPQSAAEAGVRLGQLLWVRCRNVDQALRAADLLIQGGGFGLIALDLGDTPARMARAIPLPVWFRMRRAVENTPTILVALEQEANAKTCASLVLRLEAREARWTKTGGMGDREEKNSTVTKRAPFDFAQGKWGSCKIFRGETSCEQFEEKTPRPKDEHGAPESSKRDEQILLSHTQGCLFEGARNYAEVIRSRAKKEGDRLVWRNEKSEGAEFETRARLSNSSRG
jgi:recombination protein RecA